MRPFNLKYILLLVGICFLFQSNTYGQIHPLKKDKPLNAGIRFGFNALSATSFNAYEGDTQLTNETYTNQPGYSLNAFFRINLDRFFMQPEAGWNIYKQKFSYSLPMTTEEGETDSWSSPYKLSRNSQTANINILVGYNIIKNGPYVFSAFAGPSFKYNYYSKYTYLDNVFRDNSAYYNTYGIVGFSFNIFKFYVDIRYEICIFDTDINFNEISETPEIFKNITIDKRENILSFSCGIFF